MTEMTILMLHKNVSRETSVKQLCYIILRFLYGNVEGMLLSRSPIATTDSRTRLDSYSSRAFVSSHSRKLANAQTERSVAATSAVLVTESELSSTYQHYYWMRWESLYRKNDFITLYRVQRWYLIIQLLSYYLYLACIFMQGTWWLKWLYLCYIRMFHVKHRTATAWFLWRTSCHPVVVNYLRYLYKQQ